MKIKIVNNIKKFQDIIKIIEGLCLEVDFIFEEEKLFIKIIHPSKHTLAMFSINKEFFDEYEFDKIETSTIDTTEFGKLVRKIGKKELLIEFKDDAMYLSNKKDSFKFKYYIGPKENNPLPSPEFIVKYKIKPTELFSVVSDLSSFNDVCNIVSDEKLSIKVKGNLIEGETITEAEKVSGEKTNCYYDLTYLNCISGIKNLFKEVDFNFGEDVPCYIKGETDELIFEWFLAPRAE
ncbi:hypothetical protein KAI04_03985 [Candidatus Pacearchaeota archaeon]|nr:hypothetical protein [Candidatus Pacearchaeota archaeon]